MSFVTPSAVLQDPSFHTSVSLEHYLLSVQLVLMLLLAKMNKISLSAFLLNFYSTSEQSGSLRERASEWNLSKSHLFAVGFVFPTQPGGLTNSADIGFPMLVLMGEEVNILCGWLGGRPLLLQTRSFVKLSYFRLSCVVIAWWELTKREDLGAILTQSKCFCWAQSHLCTCFPVIC